MIIYCSWFTFPKFQDIQCKCSDFIAFCREGIRLIIYYEYHKSARPFGWMANGASTRGCVVFDSSCFFFRCVHWRMTSRCDKFFMHSPGRCSLYWKLVQWVCLSIAHFSIERGESQPTTDSRRPSTARTDDYDSKQTPEPRQQKCENIIRFNFKSDHFFFSVPSRCCSCCFCL